MSSVIFCFEICPNCSQILRLSPEQLKPMVLSGDDKEMQCDVCNHSFKLPDCKPLKELARRQRTERYGCYRCGCGEDVPNGEFCIDCDLARDLFEGE